MLKFLPLVFIIVCCISCNNSNTTKTPADPCTAYIQTLNGIFKAEIYEGTVTFEGGLEGTMETEGIEFNGMTCNYTITNCGDGTATMNCEGSSYETQILILGQDQIQINQNIYNRVKG